MEYVEFIQKISFRFYQPWMYPKGFTKLSKILKKFTVSLEVLNTRLPEHAQVLQGRLIELLTIPRMSTFAIGTILNEGVSRLADQTCFVNVGVWHGFTLLAGMKDNPHQRCIGIDNFSEFESPKAALMERFERYKSPQHAFYEMDYRAYFRQVHQGQIGLYLYDGEHSYANQLQGLRIVEPFLAEHGIILIDDTNRPDPRQATLDFISQSPHHYRIVLDQQTCIGDHPTFWNGLMILEKMP
jgi:hypothetical protein